MRSFKNMNMKTKRKYDFHRTSNSSYYCIRLKVKASSFVRDSKNCHTTYACTTFVFCTVAYMIRMHNANFKCTRTVDCKHHIM